jgi:hypothetical protein
MAETTRKDESHSNQPTTAQREPKRIETMSHAELVVYARVLEARLSHFRSAVQRSRERVSKVVQDAECIAREHRNALATLLTLQQEAEGITV